MKVVFTKPACAIIQGPISLIAVKKAQNNLILLQNINYDFIQKERRVFCLADGVSRFLRNVDNYFLHCTASHIGSCLEQLRNTTRTSVKMVCLRTGI
jgi:hypothetical protein